jgi:hypothetical protein
VLLRQVELALLLKTRARVMLAQGGWIPEIVARQPDLFR